MFPQVSTYPAWPLTANDRTGQRNNRRVDTTQHPTALKLAPTIPEDGLNPETVRETLNKCEKHRVELLDWFDRKLLGAKTAIGVYAGPCSFPSSPPFPPQSSGQPACWPLPVSLRPPACRETVTFWVCGLRGSTQHLGLEIPVGMGRRCCDGPSYEYCGTDRDLGSVRGWSDFHGDSGVGRAAVEHGAGLCGPSRVPAACGAACLVFGTDVADGPRRDISGAGSG